MPGALEMVMTNRRARDMADDIASGIHIAADALAFRHGDEDLAGQMRLLAREMERLVEALETNEGDRR